MPTVSIESGLTYDDIGFYFKYDNNPEKLIRWFRKVVPVANWGSLTHDIVIDIENGGHARIPGCGIRNGRVTTGLLGYFSMVLHCAAHFSGTEFISRLQGYIAAVLGIEDLMSALFLCRALVTEMRSKTCVFQGESAKLLVPMVEDYCKNHFGEGKIPIASAESTPSRLYSKEPDQSFQPGYYVGADNGMQLPTAICEVTMGGQLGRLVFNCLSSIAGSGGKIDLSVGVDIAFDNHSSTGVRLFVFDTTITTLARFAKNASVARFTRSKIENRLIHLRYLRDHLHEQQRFKDYLHLEHTIEPTIQYYERTQEYLVAISGGQVTDEDIVETCRVVLHNAEVAQISRENRDFSVRDTNGESLSGLAVKVEAFLGLILGFEAQVVLDNEALTSIAGRIASECEVDQLRCVPVFPTLVLTKRYIANDKYSEFVAKQGSNFNREAFEQGQPVAAPKVWLDHLNENVVERLAKAYLRKFVRSRYMRTAAAYSWLESKFKARVTEYDLTKCLKAKSVKSHSFLWSKDYTNLVNELLDIHPTTPDEREYFRRVLGHNTIKNLLYMDIYKRALAQIIHGRGSLTEFLEELGKDENKARLCLEALLANAT